MLVLGYGFKRVIVDPLISHGVIPLVIATLGVSIAVKSIVRAGYSAEAHPFPSPFPRRPVRACRDQHVSMPTSARCWSRALIVVVLQAFLNDRYRPRDAGGRAEHRCRTRARASTSGEWSCTCS